MLIEKIKLTNFGIHRDVEFALGGNSNVVGLLGSNGSGKSTILEALKYAFTGDLTGTLESYKSVNADSNGQVEVKFVKDGVKGKIVRQVGKGRLKTSFKWNQDKVLTAKKSVDTKLQEILGVDKKALANAIFLPQGRLDSLLFGTKTEREELFVKLVNMSYCQRRSEIIALKSKQIKSDIQDLTATIEEAESSYLTAFAARTEIVAQIKDTVDYTEDIKTLRDKQKIDSDIDTRIKYLTEEQAAHTLLSEEIGNTESGLRQVAMAAGYASDVTFEKALEQQKEKYNDLINQRTELVSDINKIQNRDKLLHKLETAEQDIETTKLNLTELFGKQIIPVVTKTDLDNLKRQYGELKFEAEQIVKWRDMNKELNEGKAHEVACPLCGFEETNCYDPDLEELDKLVDKKKKALSALQTTLQSQTELFEGYDYEIQKQRT